MTSRSQDAKPYIHANFMKTWRKMEELVDLGLVRHIGTSNMTIPKLKLLLRDARIKPAVNEMELHPHFQQPELFEFVRANGMIPVGYCPDRFAGAARAGPYCRRHRAHSGSGDCQDRESPGRASGGGLHQVGRPARADADSVFHQSQTLPGNLEGVVSDPLTADDMREISTIDRNCRLIKGQVFLWKDGQSWEDLWDLNGEITPP